MLVFRLFRCQYVQCVPRDSIMTDQPTFMGCEPDRMGLELRAPWSAPIITNLDFRFGFPNFYCITQHPGLTASSPCFQLDPLTTSPIRWGDLGTMKVMEGPVLNSLATMFAEDFPGATTQHLSNMVWSFARLRSHHPSFLDGLAAEAASRMNQFTAQEAANTSWAFATLRLQLVLSLVAV